MFERPWHDVQRLLPPKEGTGWGRDRERLKRKKYGIALHIFPVLEKYPTGSARDRILQVKNGNFFFSSFSLVSYCCGMTNITHSISTTVSPITARIVCSNALQSLVIYSYLCFITLPRPSPCPSSSNSSILYR